jgi:hypothetical protein
MIGVSVINIVSIVKWRIGMAGLSEDINPQIFSTYVYPTQVKSTEASNTSDVIGVGIMN